MYHVIFIMYPRDLNGLLSVGTRQLYRLHCSSSPNKPPSHGVISLFFQPSTNENTTEIHHGYSQCQYLARVLPRTRASANAFFRLALHSEYLRSHRENRFFPPIVTFAQLSPFNHHKQQTSHLIRAMYRIFHFLRFRLYLFPSSAAADRPNMRW